MAFFPKLGICIDYATMKRALVFVSFLYSFGLISHDSFAEPWVIRRAVGYLQGRGLKQKMPF